MDFNFIVKESHTRIEVTPLADGTYELTQDPDGDFSEAQTNVVELTEAPNFSQNSRTLQTPLQASHGA